MVKKYNKALKDKVDVKTMVKDLRILQQAAESKGWTEELEREYNKIHERVQEARLESEKGLRKLRMGNVPWSPQIQQARNQVELWLLLLRRSEGKTMSYNKVRRLLKHTAVNVTNIFQLQKEGVKSNLQQAREHYREEKKRAALMLSCHLFRLVFL